MALREEYSANYDRAADEGVIEFQEAMGMSYGKDRRKKILESLEKGFMFMVNCKHRPQMKDDADLRRLVKQGKVKLCNYVDSRKCTKQFIKLSEEK